MNRNSVDVRLGTVLSYPYAINQPVFVNYHPAAIIQTQMPAVYYFLPPEPNVYQNQFVFVNAAPMMNQHISTGNVQIPRHQNSIVQNINQNGFIIPNRVLYEK